MAREIKGYALKVRLGLVPFRYPAPVNMRGVQPPVRHDEGRQFDRDAVLRHRGRFVGQVLA